MFFICLIVAAASGVCMAVQGSLNSMVGKVIGLWEGNFLVHSIGLIIISVLLFVVGMGKGDFSKISALPWYGYLGGVINVAIIYGVMFAISKIGATNGTVAIITGQLVAAMLLDLFGVFGLEKTDFAWTKLIGVILMAFGAKFMLSK